MFELLILALRIIAQLLPLLNEVSHTALTLLLVEHIEHNGVIGGMRMVIVFRQEIAELTLEISSQLGIEIVQKRSHNGGVIGLVIDGLFIELMERGDLQ